MSRHGTKEIQRVKRVASKMGTNPRYEQLFIRRALRLIKRLNDHCRDDGLHAYLGEMDTWNPSYASDVRVLMGEAFEIMRLSDFAKEHGLVVPD